MPRTETRTLYTFRELSEEAQEKAVKTERRRRERFADVPWLAETAESYRAILDALGLKMDRDGDPRPFPDDGIGALRGARAMAWVENNLLGPLRIPYRGEGRNKVRKYGRYYRPGMVKPCPWTGYFADDAFIQAFVDAVRSGDSLDEATQSIVSELRRIEEAEAEAYYGDEGIRENLANWEANYLEDGTEA